MSRNPDLTLFVHTPSYEIFLKQVDFFSDLWYNYHIFHRIGILEVQ